jgi:hypothetical protein
MKMNIFIAKVEVQVKVKVATKQRGHSSLQQLSSILVNKTNL